MFIEVKDARKQYGSGEAAVYALDGIDFTLDEGKSVSYSVHRVRANRRCST